MSDLDDGREFFVDLDNATDTATGTLLTIISTMPSLSPTDIDMGLSYKYVCQDTSVEGMACPMNCTGLNECMECQCQVAQVEDTGGPWGQVMDVLFCLLPIIYLLYATVKPNPTPTTTSLPCSALIMFLVRVMYLGSNPLLTSSCVLLGLHEAITPLTIMAGAITLFETMEATKCLPYMMREMKALTAGHPVAEVMLLFGFATLVEGASGFGTPVALGAPMLVSTGHPPLESVVILLLFNTFATVWGAVGTPLWFGFGELGLSDDDFIEISMQAAVAMVFSAFILIPFILTILVPFRIVKRNIIFLLLSIATVMGPILGLASFNYEFPSLMGGLIGMMFTAILINFKIGLADMQDEEIEETVEKTQEQVDDVLEIADLTKGYHRAISDLTEAHIPRHTTNDDDDDNDKVPTSAEQPKDVNDNDNDDDKKDDNDDSDAVVPNSEISAVDEDTDNSKEDDDGSSSIKHHSSVTNGHWNIEVQNDNTLDPAATEDEGTTVVYLEEGKPTTEESEEAEKTTSAVEEPPLVEEAAAASTKGSTTGGGSSSSNNKLTKSQLLAASATSREDALLGPRKTFKEGYLVDTLMRTFPIWGVVIVLILTRVSSIGIKEYLTKQDPYWEVQFGTYGDFRLSVSAVFMVKNFLTYPGINWKYELFYVPFMIPFVVISCVTMLLYRKDMTCKPQDIAYTVMDRLSNPFIALMGALILVQLMIKNDEESPAYLLGTILAEWLREGFVVIAPLLGALGSFFSGSTTVSNLTFGEIQLIAAEQIGVSANTMLALQSFGASAGNGICLNNIIAALAVVGLNVSEGQILMRTCKFVFASTTIATVVMLAFFFRFD